MKLFSTDFIVLNSSEAISDLLDKRSSVYSDRVGHLSTPLVPADIWLGISPRYQCSSCVLSETLVSDLQLIWGLKRGLLFVEYDRSSVRNKMEEGAVTVS